MTEATEKNVLVIAGPTGSGESTVTKKIIARYPDRFTRLVTATTRPPRADERDGIDYYFLSKEEFLARKESGAMLEVTYVPNRDTYYGSYAPDLEEKLARDMIVIVNPDIVGARFYKKHYNATTVFITPQHIDELAGRLSKRNPEMRDAELEKRVENAKQEIADDQPFYDFTVVNANGALEKTVEEVVSILKREGYRF